MRAGTFPAWLCARGGFRAALGAFPSFAGRQRHRVVVLVSSDSALEKAERFSGPVRVGAVRGGAPCAPRPVETDCVCSCTQRGRERNNRLIAGCAVYGLQNQSEL